LRAACLEETCREHGSAGGKAVARRAAEGLETPPRGSDGYQNLIGTECTN